MMTEEKVYSDFWLNKEFLDQYIIEDNNDDNNKNEGFSIDLIQLATYRRVASNFVYILTHLDIPIQFFSDDNCTDGKVIYLSSSIRKKSDFDWSVGIALHEASHILLTDFSLFSSTFLSTPITLPSFLRKKVNDKNISEKKMVNLCKVIFNIIEDRFIDSYVFNEAPGYRGYYKAMYEKLWNDEKIAKILQSEYGRCLDIKSYRFRICYLTNEVTDLDALPGLRSIAEIINIENITRLKKTKDRIDLTHKVIEIIIDNLPKQNDEDTEKSSNKTIQKIHNNLLVGNKGGDNNEDDEKDENDDEIIVNDKDGDEEIEKYIKQKYKILNHDYKDVKEKISNDQKDILDVIEISNIVLIPTGFGFLNDGDYSTPLVDCIVAKKLNKQLIESSKDIFPFGTTTTPKKSHEDAVNKGFELGKLLGKRLQIRDETNVVKYIHKHKGKIERRYLADIGAGLEDIFSKIKIEKYNKARLHISVDGSGSMGVDKKWCPMITCVVAICVAMSMIQNLEVSVSLRSTILTHNNGMELPYIVLIYDSKVDKISKIKNLFPYLCANGSTPEGLTFEAVAQEFIFGKKSTEQQDRYFLNISDGEPCYLIKNNVNKNNNVEVNYSGEDGALHTKKQIEKIKLNGVIVLSYFIGEKTSLPTIISANINNKTECTCSDLFKKMYGESSKFIDLEKITDISNTINNMFLNKNI